MSAVFLVLAKLWASPTVRKVLLYAGIAVAAIAIPWVSYNRGFNRGASSMMATMMEHERAAVAAADAKYRAQELAHEKQVADLRVEFAARQSTEREVDRGAAADLSSGARRVRVQVARCSPNTTALGSAAPRADDAATAELAPEVAAGLYAIAADCDETARQLSALQNWALGAVMLCNGGTQQPVK